MENLYYYDRDVASGLDFAALFLVFLSVCFFVAMLAVHLFLFIGRLFFRIHRLLGRAYVLVLSFGIVYCFYVWSQAGVPVAANPAPIVRGPAYNVVPHRAPGGGRRAQPPNR